MDGLIVKKCALIKKANRKVRAAGIAVGLALFVAATLPGLAQTDGTDAAGSVLANMGGDMGGHTPIGFQGQGAGIFVGDNLNARFPNGEGVQAFISFDLSAMTGEPVTSANLRSRYLKVSGNPFTDLGAIRLEPIRFDRFSSAIWDLETKAGSGCVLKISPDQSGAECDLTEAVQSTLAEGLQILQFRLRFERVSDSDGQPDLALFFKQDSNINEGGVFELTVR